MNFFATLILGMIAVNMGVDRVAVLAVILSYALFLISHHYVIRKKGIKNE